MDIPLTAFSILMARKKGLLEEAVRGAAAIDGAEGRRQGADFRGLYPSPQCEDIGTVKIPPVAGELHRKAAGHCAPPQANPSRGFVGVQAGDPLRRLYAQ